MTVVIWDMTAGAGLHAGEIVICVFAIFLSQVLVAWLSNWTSAETRESKLGETRITPHMIWARAKTPRIIFSILWILENKFIDKITPDIDYQIPGP